MFLSGFGFFLLFLGSLVGFFLGGELCVLCVPLSVPVLDSVGFLCALRLWCCVGLWCFSTSFFLCIFLC